MVSRHHGAGANAPSTIGHRLPGPSPWSGATVAYLSLAFAVAPIMVMATAPSSFMILVGVLGAMMMLLLSYEWRRVGHPLTPAGVLALAGLLLFVLRPLTVRTSGLTTAGAAADTRAFLGESVTAGATALWQVILFYGFGGLALFVRHSSTMLKEPVAVPETARFSVVRARALLYAALGVSCAITALLVASSGGLSDHLSGVSLRSSFLAGRYFLTLGYIPLAVALCLYVLVRRFQASAVEWDSHAWFAAVMLVVIALLTGGRGPLVLGVLFPLLLLKQSSSKRFKGPALVAIGFAVLVSSMLMSIVLRDNAYDSGESITLLQRNPVGVLLDRLTMGVETRPFDSLILLNEVDQSGNLELLLGASYLTVPSWFIPGSLMPGKIGGANAWFTSNYLPRFYYPDRIETSISAIGEGFANFGYIGVAIAGVLMGLAAAHLSLSPAVSSLRTTLFSVLLTPIFFSLLRGDAYQNLSLALVISCLAVICIKLVTHASARHQRAKGHALKFDRSVRHHVPGARMPRPAPAGINSVGYLFPPRMERSKACNSPAT